MLVLFSCTTCLGHEISALYYLSLFGFAGCFGLFISWHLQDISTSLWAVGRSGFFFVSCSVPLASCRLVDRALALIGQLCKVSSQVTSSKLTIFPPAMQFCLFFIILFLVSWALFYHIVCSVVYVFLCILVFLGYFSCMCTWPNPS